MNASKLDREMAKLDMKLSHGKNVRDRVTLEFFIRYCSPQSIEMDREGIVVCVHRSQPDRMGRNGLAVLEDVYPLSLEGLESAREGGLVAVKGLYNLPKDIRVAEVENFPRSYTNRNYNVIYRVDFLNVLEIIAQQEEGSP